MSFITGIIGAGASLGSQIVGDQITREEQATRADFLRGVTEERAERITEGGEAQYKAFLAQSTAASLDAQRVDQVTKQQILEIREQGRGVVAQFQAKAAASGVDFDSGSPLETAAQAAFVAEKTASIKEQRAGFQISSLLLRARDLKAHAANTRFAALSAARSTILTGFAQAAGINVSAPTEAETFSTALAGSAAILGQFGQGSLRPTVLSSGSNFGTESGNQELLLN